MNEDNSKMGFREAARALSAGDAVAKHFFDEIIDGGMMRQKFATKILLPELQKKMIMGEVLGKLYSVCAGETTILLKVAQQLDVQTVLMLNLGVTMNCVQNETWDDLEKACEEIRKDGQEEGWYPEGEKQMKANDAEWKNMS